MRVKMELIVHMRIRPLDSEKKFSSGSTQRQDSCCAENAFDL